MTPTIVWASASSRCNHKVHHVHRVHHASIISAQIKERLFLRKKLDFVRSMKATSYHHLRLNFARPSRDSKKETKLLMDDAPKIELVRESDDQEIKAAGP